MDLKNITDMSNSKKIQAYVGKAGSGKTLQMIIDALLNYQYTNKVVYLSTELNINFINKRIVKICKNLKIDIPKINEFVIDIFNLNTLKNYIEDSEYKHIYIDTMYLNHLNSSTIIEILNLTQNKAIQIYCGFNTNETIKPNVDIANNKYYFFETYAIVEKEDNIINTKYVKNSKFSTTYVDEVLKEDNDDFILKCEIYLKKIGFKYLKECPFTNRACYRKDNLSYYFDNHTIEYIGGEFSHITKKVTSLEKLKNFINIFENE